MLTRFDVINKEDSEVLKAAALVHVESISLGDALQKVTAFRDLTEIVTCSLESGYQPTLSLTPQTDTFEEFVYLFMVRKVADAYDAEMAKRGSSIRAWRGSKSYKS